AIVAAIYLNGGINAARKFIANMVMPRQTQVSSEVFDALDRNFKSALLEFSQARGLGSPRYNLIKEEGPDHDRTFTVEVLIGEESRGIGTGKTKKAAEQAAAEMAFEKLKREKGDP
ncbi:MAG: putative dsRNA-binding protein, partial [Candidatus Kryptoniota bacterium]